MLIVLTALSVVLSSVVSICSPPAAGTRVSFDFHGRGWMEACEDVVFPGLGWVSITGSGQMTVRAILPGQTRAYAREPLMPYESRHNMKKWTGSAVRQH